MMKKKLTAIFILMALLSTCFVPVLHSAGAELGETGFTVSEQSGSAISNYLVKRGIPLAQGALQPSEIASVSAVCAGETYPLQTSVLEKYADGSVKWLSVAFEVSLGAGESKRFTLQKKAASPAQSVSVSQSGGNYTVSNGHITAVIGASGLQSLSFDGEAVLSGRESSVCLEKKLDSKTGQPTGSLVEYTAQNGTAEILEQGGIFVTIRVKMPYGDSTLRCEKLYTISAGASKITCDTTYVSYQGKYLGMSSRYTQIGGLRDTYDLGSAFSVSKISEGNTYAVAQSSKTGVIFISRDADRFRGAFGDGSTNGVFQNAGKIVCAPLIYSGLYNWWDGYSRTVSHEIVCGEQDGEKALAIQEAPPFLAVDSQCYVRAGLLRDTGLSPLAQAQIETIKWGHKENYGKMEAGAIPYTIDAEQNDVGDKTVMLGDVDYNTWFGVMASGDAALYRAVDESTQSFADLSIYEGACIEARGIPRYRILDEDRNSMTGHLYYGEFSNLYIAYLMTGNVVYKEKFYEMADTMYQRTMHSDANLFSGFHVARAGSLNGNLRYALTSYEIRCAYVIRALQNASLLFEDNRFSYLADELLGWCETLQEEDGSWPQLVDANGNKVANTVIGKPLYKNYIMLYTIAGHIEYCRLTKDSAKKERSFAMIQKFGDYLIGEMGDRGWMWDPVGDKAKTETSEDYSRGKAPFQEMMASEVFAFLYEQTGETKYFKSMCAALETYLCSARESGFVSQRYNDRNYMDGAVTRAISGKNTVLLRMDSGYRHIFSDSENMALASGLGYEAVASVFCGAEGVQEKVTNSFSAEEVAANYYESADGKYLFIGNNSGKRSNAWTKDVCFTVAESSRLWSNMLCRRQGDAMRIEKELAWGETAACTELPISVSGSENVCWEVIKYDADAVILRLTGSGTAGFELSDGIFAIEDASSYFVLTFQNGEGAYAVITKAAGGMKPADGKLSAELTVTREKTDYYSQWQ